MKVLWVKSGGLLPLDTGGKIRSYQLAKELAGRHEVTLFTFYPEIAADPHGDLDQVFARVIRMPLKLARRASIKDCLNYGWNLFSGQPHSMTKYCRPEVSYALREHLRQCSYDVIICDFLLTAAVIPWDNPTPTIIFTHNVEAIIWKRHFEVNKNPLWKAISWREYRTMDKAERFYLGKADHVLTVSQADRDIFSDFLNVGKMTVIETGVNLNYFQPQHGTGVPHSMVFTGSMDWLPNEDAILFFAEQILPKIRARFPGAYLTVVGRSPSARLRTLASSISGLKIAGRVEDIRPYVRDASIYIVPLRIGGGTRIKIFEAMAMGKAVVSTSIGAEGLPITDGLNILLADTPDAFADKIASLFVSHKLRIDLGRSARALVEGRYSWASVACQFDGVFQRLVASLPTPPTANETVSIS